MSTTTRRSASPNIARHRIRERDASRRDFQVELLDGESFDDALNPSFLGAKADVFQPGDRIAIVGHELAFWGEVIVIESRRGAGRRQGGAARRADRSYIAHRRSGAVRRVQGRSRELEPRQLEAALGQFGIASGFKSQKAANERLNEIRQGRKALARW